MADIIDPDRPIVDPHHHLWLGSHIGADENSDYVLADLHGDTGTGHNITKTVFIECGAGYRASGPDHLRPLGETEFVAAIADESATAGGAVITGIVAHADLSLPVDELDAVLDGHDALAGGRFRGIRDALSSAPPDVALMIPGRADPGKAGDPDFRRGVARLGERGLTYDTWHYHFQNQDFLELARAVPGTTMVLDHFGTPIGVDRFADRRDEIFESWKADITALATCDNVVAKLGGLAMPDNGFFDWTDPDGRPDVDVFVDAQARYYHHTIQAFGPDRCMFESNFPVDKFCLDYDVFWNGAKTIAADYTDAEQGALFAGTATRVYRL